MALSKLLELHVWLVPNINYSALHYSTGYVWHLMIGVLAECYLMLKGKMPGKNQKKTLNKIGSETSMKKHWKNMCVNYLQNVKFRVKKRFLRLAAVHVLQQRLWKWWWKLPALPSFHALIKRRRTWFHYVTWIRDCKIVWQTFFVLIWLRWLHFWGGRCKIILLLQFCSRQKKREIIWIWWLFSDLHWIFKKERKIVFVFFWWNTCDNFCFVPEHFS